jgi:hypothetical protein
MGFERTKSIPAPPHCQPNDMDNNEKNNNTIIIFIKSPFELTYFLIYAKQLIQINKLLCIIYKFVKIFYEIIAHEDSIFISENL